MIGFKQLEMRLKCRSRPIHDADVAVLVCLGYFIDNRASKGFKSYMQELNKYEIKAQCMSTLL